MRPGQAECRSAKDQKAILEELRSGVGFSECNQRVIGLLKEALANQAKAALTELRCNVNLKEAWKGTLEDAHILDQGDANGENYWDKWLETPVAQAAIRAEMEAEGILPDSYLDVKAPVNVS